MEILAKLNKAEKLLAAVLADMNDRDEPTDELPECLAILQDLQKAIIPASKDEVTVSFDLSDVDVIDSALEEYTKDACAIGGLKSILEYEGPVEWLASSRDASKKINSIRESLLK